MRAVNLLPAQPRRGALGFSISAPLAGVCGGLALVLAGTALYVGEHNSVNTRQAELTKLSIGVAHWSAAAKSYSRFTAEAQQHARRLVEVQELVGSRYDWENLLAQIAGLLPHDAQISALSATSPSASVTSTATDGTTEASGSAVQLSGCATTQSVVAQTMVQLRHITGVSGVALSSSTSSGATGAASSTSSAGCDLAVQFQLALNFASPVTPGAAGTHTATATTGTTGTADTATPSAS